MSVAFLFLITALRLLPEKPATTEHVGPDAVFTPAADFIATFHAACDGKSGDAFGECFLAQMKKGGASPAALAFARRTGNQAYLKALHETGNVDVALAVYPFRANENEVWLLVNGKPPVVDIWYVAPIQKLLDANSVYKSLKLDNPKISAFPRPMKDGPRVLPAKDGQRFAVAYDLKDCHACKAAGYALVSFNFDAAGNFLGPELGQVKPYYH